MWLFLLQECLNDVKLKFLKHCNQLFYYLLTNWLSKLYLYNYLKISYVYDSAPHFKSLLGALNQDGRVEGHALTPSCKNSRITTKCWTIFDRKTLELTKKDTPHPKKKEKPQWDGRRGTITIKSNPTTAGWVTHKLENTHITEVHPVEWRFWTPRQASQSGGPATGGGILRESDFEI